jgi:hypothetical protein
MALRSRTRYLEMTWRARRRSCSSRESFVGKVKGVEYVVKQGDQYSSNHPAAKAHPELFAPHRSVNACFLTPGENTNALRRRPWEERPTLSEEVFGWQATSRI